MKPSSNDAREARNTSAEELPRNIDGAVEGPTMVRRSMAKAIDFVAVGFTVTGFTAFTHSYLAGLLVGYGWLALSDWGASIGKWITGLAVRDYRTGASCSAVASIIRNAPLVAVSLPYRLHQAVLGLDRAAYKESYFTVVAIFTALALMTILGLLISAGYNPQSRHFGDLLAGTVVTSTKRKIGEQGRG
jgi:uncharacterized RDD family membrane protein YckC